ncbi:MAG TPA: threonylcarbamoyl-AMP synthase [Kiritimatiellae bacterium]|nr:threonylcarbamoyl-AMP synthase [Kiritimatiellia bacterium]
MAGVPLVVAVETDDRLGEAVRMAVDALRRGRLVAIPTETVYGLAADPQVRGAVGRLYTAKHRDTRKPIAWFVDSVGEIERVGAEATPLLEKLAERFWPGPLTVIVRHGSGTRGFRIPRHRVPLEILKVKKGPLAVTSANRSGEPPARSPAEVIAAVGEHISLVITDPPQCGRAPSTVVDISGGDVRILREGAIPWAQILEVVREAG